MLVILPKYFVIKLPFCRSSFVENESWFLLHLSVGITWWWWVHVQTFLVNLSQRNITISVQKPIYAYYCIRIPAYAHTTNFVKNMFIIYASIDLKVCKHKYIQHHCTIWIVILVQFTTDLLSQMNSSVWNRWLRTSHAVVPTEPCSTWKVLKLWKFNSIRFVCSLLPSCV